MKERGIIVVGKLGGSGRSIGQYMNIKSTKDNAISKNVSLDANYQIGVYEELWEEEINKVKEKGNQ
jgi:hypothetical protein